MATKKPEKKKIRMIEEEVPVLGSQEDTTEEIVEEVTEQLEEVEEQLDDEVQEQEPEDVGEDEGEGEDEEDIPVLTDEYILIEKMFVTHSQAPTFAIIRDILDDSDPDRWDNVLLSLERRDMYSRVYDLRDGYLTELGKHYARFTLGLTPEI